MATSTPTNKPADDNWLGDQAPKLPTTLNVLTWLTFIWNVIMTLWAFYAFAVAPSSYENLVKNQDKLDQMPGFLKAMMGDHPVETARIAMENRLPILLISLLAAFLCFFGALYMRKLKKVGFSIYILGDLVPFALYIFIGTDTAKGGGFIFGICILALFVILYATQLKHMKQSS
jgi:hypothetical protein